MTEIQLSIPYRHLVTRQGQSLTWALWPVWAVLAPLCLLLTLAAAAVYPASFAPAVTALLLIVPIIIVGLGLTVATIAQDDKIHVGRDGIFFPKMLAPRLGFRRYVPWDKLVGADMVAQSNDASCLRLVVRGCGAVDVDLNGVQSEIIEQFLLAVELWAEHCERSPALIDYQHQLQNRLLGVAAVSYTKMWEQELARRFTATAFVPLEPGARLHNGRLKVVRQLGSGGFSAVYLVQDKSGLFMVAKEAVIPFGASDEQIAKLHEHFAREASTLANINHPRVARVYDHFTEGERSYLLLEYIEGNNLRQHVEQNGALSAASAATIARELAQILDYLHQRNPPVVHRDVSPDNIVLRPDNSVVLIDFGAANYLLSQATGTMVGKQAYMPPEQVRGKAVIESDYYAFGGTLHFLVTGQDPIPLSVSNPQLKGENEEIQFNLLVQRLTAFEPAQRRHADQTLSQTVRDVLAGDGVRS